MADAPLALIAHPALLATEAGLQAMGYRTAHLWEPADGDLATAETIIIAGRTRLRADLLTQMPKLKLVAYVSAGYDGVEIDWCHANNVMVSHAKGMNADDVSDHAVGLLIASWRNIVDGDRVVRDGTWAGLDLTKLRPPLRGLKVGIVGLGAIGQAVARRVEPFGMQVSWWGPRDRPADWPRAESLLALAQASDILVIASRADDSNVGMIDRAIIDAVGPGGLIVNVARGTIINEPDLIAALKDGRLGRAALDVFETEPTPVDRWVGVPNTVLTPHTAGHTTDGIPRQVGQAMENLRRYIAGEEILNLVEPR